MKKICIQDLEYPELLRKIEDPPQQLYVEGNIDILKNKGISIIGSRLCTDYGKTQALKFSEDLSKHGLTIISGMAIGIDSYAHKGCIQSGGKTIAILGGGFNYIYPKENIILFEKIIESGGAVISEYEPHVKYTSKTFPQRNRIVSGLSLGTLVIEAAHRSGTSITARITKEQGKPVFCIPNSIEASKSVGTNRLLKQYAILVTQSDDILKVLNINKTKVKITNNNIYIPKMPDEYFLIYKVLSKSQLNINDLSKKLNMKISELNSKLLIMELNGYIEQLPNSEFKCRS